jgi:hypothetical protein
MLTGFENLYTIPLQVQRTTALVMYSQPTVIVAGTPPREQTGESLSIFVRCGLT